MPGLGARLGRGGATTTLASLAESDCIVIMGSNMAENHPVGFRFVVKARQRGATVIHIDPRFSRTSALADLHVPIRPGSDLVFLGALVNYVLTSERWQNDPFFKEYLMHYTNAPVIISPQYRDAEDLAGLFSGYDPSTRKYDPSSWQYAGEQRAVTSDRWPCRPVLQPELDPTLEHPHCVLQLVKRHFARYTPDLVEQSCGVPRELFLRVAETILANSGRDRTTAFCYAVAWTQHTIGTQIISCCALLQLLLGNIGRPGGGILALRGHATIQGSTDIPTLYDLLPGYLKMPRAIAQHATLADYFATERPATGLWYEMPKFLISLLKAWYGETAKPENDFAYSLLPKIGGDYSFQSILTMMKDGIIRGLFVMGMNPAVGGQNARLARRALANLDWLVVRDIHEIETASFWYDAPEVHSGEVKPDEIKTEVFFLPAAVAAEKDGTFTNTHRLVQWHEKAAEPTDDARSEAHFIYHLGRRLKELYAGDHSPAGQQIAALTWDYPTVGPQAEPDLLAVAREISGFRVADGQPLAGFHELADDGSTACGCWIYSGIVTPEGEHRAKRRHGDDRASLDWGFAWPANRRILYNRASADPQGRPWSERKKWIWWDDTQRRWVGYDVPDFPATKPPDYVPSAEARGLEAHPGTAPFIMMLDGRGWLFVPTGLVDGPLPTHYEPWETPVPNALYPAQTRSPVAPAFWRPDNPYHEIDDPRYPYILTTYRLTEHLTAGGMSRWLPWLAELQPAGFVEMSPELAHELGISNGDWVVIETARSQVEARALVTERMQPLTIAGRTLHVIGMPWHFGFGGLANGGIANELAALIEDPNSLIHEAKAFTCTIRRGRLRAEGKT